MVMNYTIRPRKKDVAFLQTQLLIAQKEIQLQAEEFDFMVAAGDLEEIEEVNANYILMTNLQQASTLGTQTNKAPIYDSDGSTENDSNVISAVSSVEQSGGTVEQNPAIVEETRAYFESLYNNLAIEVEKVITNPFSQTSSAKKQSLHNGKVLLEKHDPPDVYDSEDTLQLAQASRLKMKQLNKEIKQANYAKINQLSGVFVSQKAKSREELYFLNTSKTAAVSKSISIPNEEFSDDTSPSVARKFLNEIERLQAQLGDLKGKSKDTPCESNTLDSLSRKLENENVELEFQVLNHAKENAHFKTTYKNLFDSINKLENENVELEFKDLNHAKENAHFKTTYKNPFDSINVTRAQAKTIIDSLQQKLHDRIYENAKLRAQLFNKVSEQKNITKGTSVNTKFANKSTERKPSLQSLRNNFVVRQPNAFQSK
nr:hypothetical protein [Tanacetum cinerariifolium]